MDEVKESSCSFVPSGCFSAQFARLAHKAAARIHLGARSSLIDKKDPQKEEQDLP